MRIGTICLAVLLSAASAGGGEAATGSAGAPDPSWPKWRRVMAEPNTVYNISDNALVSIRFTFLGGKIPTQFSNSDGEAGTGGTIFGYGGGALFSGVGKYGVLVFGSGGENFSGNMTGALRLDGDAAHYEVWQEPIYRTKAEPGAEFYWNPAEAEALPESRRIPHLKFDKANWDGQFPMAIGGWVYPAPVKYLELAEGVPLGQYRYDQHCFVPAEHTGLGAGVWFIPSVCFTAPGFYYGPDKKVLADFWPSGKKKWYSHYQREDNKAWARLPVPVPETVGPGSFSSQVVGFSAKHKKVIVPYQGTNGDTGIFDVSEGVPRGTWSVKPGVRKGNGTHGLRCGQKSAMSNGHPRNRAFFVWYGGGPYGGAPTSLCVMDLDDPACPTYAVKLPLKGSGERIGLHYIPSMDKFISFGVWGNPAQARCQKITIPDKLDDFDAYRVEDLPLTAAAGVDLASSYTNSGMVQYVEKLDCVVFLATNKPAKAFFIK
ncbi:MAG: hypothetical protein FJ291_29165 [Planctomycetes bacterium]|nr:hypothetical protein [Planctomycetota bacterium]